MDYKALATTILANVGGKENVTMSYTVRQGSVSP